MRRGFELMNFEQLKALDQGSAMPTYARFDLGIVRGSGATAYDAQGRAYIDFSSGIGVNSLGYCEPGWVRAVCEQAQTLQHTSNLYYNPATARLTDRLTSLTGMARVFMCNSGAEANECAVKLSRKYSYDTYGAGRHTIVSLRNSFHGRTMQTLTATGQDALHPDCFKPYVPGYVYVPSGDIQAFRAVCDGSVCAVMLELIQGEGGVVPLEQEYVRAVCELARQQDILVIVDEVQTGMARTGKLLACEHYGIRPDIVTLAKGLGGGLPIGACLCNEKLQNVMTPGSHGSTFGGNPVVCAGADYVLSVVSQPDFLSEVARKGAYLRGEIAAMPGVRSVRGLGMMLGIELTHRTGAQVAKECIEQGLIVLTAKELVRLLPPLNSSDEELKQGLEILRRVLAQ